MTLRFSALRKKIDTPKGKAWYWSVQELNEFGCDAAALPYSLRVLLENTLRNEGRASGAAEAAQKVMDWPRGVGAELPFMPSRVLLQDYTGVPLIVDLAAMRDAVKELGLDPKLVNSKVPVDLIVDHSIQVDRWASLDAIPFNLEKEYERNSERYSLLKWAQSAFSNVRVFPPGKGICHQVNLEYISTVVTLSVSQEGLLAYPDTLVGTDSHTTMVNGMAVLGWGVGGIEAEAVMLGEPYHMPVPKVTGVKLTGSLPEGSTPTDLVLTVTEALRRKGVVGQFVEYFGDGFENLSVPDRATIGNMSPEYGATVGFSPIDSNTLDYLRGTGRDEGYVRFVERYARDNAMFYDARDPPPKYSDVIEIDLGKVEPSIAGPRNPDERISLASAPVTLRTILEEQRKKLGGMQSLSRPIADNGFQPLAAGSQQLLKSVGNRSDSLEDGSVIIAAITSCTNTSNPTVMLGAALMAEKLVKLGLAPKPYVKTSMAPGSRVVTDYLNNSGLMPYLEKLGFNVVGYGCTTCIGNSGPLSPDVEEEIRRKNLYAVAVLSGNRNFDGRIHPLAKGSFLTSPMLVVAYSIAGRIDFDFAKNELGVTSGGRKVFLRDVWPSMEEIRRSVSRSLNPELFRSRYIDATEGDERWKALESGGGDVYEWDPESTYIKQPPWFKAPARTSGRDVVGARVLAVFEDKVTTDHISPAGTIPPDSPAGRYLKDHGVDVVNFSTYGSRRGNHEVMVRGGFANIRLKNLLAGGKEGGWTTHQPSGQLMTIFDAASRYESEGVPLIVLAGKEYGAGSSRDWAAKAPLLLGVKVVIAETFERIHRSNLVAMGILPLEFEEGQSWRSLGLTGREMYTIRGIESMNSPGEHLEVAVEDNFQVKKFKVKSRIDNASEMLYYRSAGVLPYVLGQFTNKETSSGSST